MILYFVPNRSVIDVIFVIVVVLGSFIWQCNKISTMKCGGEIGDISRTSTIAHSLHLFFKKKANRVKLSFTCEKVSGFQIYVGYVIRKPWTENQLWSTFFFCSVLLICYLLRSIAENRGSPCEFNSNNNNNRVINELMKCTHFVSWDTFWVIAHNAIETTWRITLHIHTHILYSNGKILAPYSFLLHAHTKSWTLKKAREMQQTKETRRKCEELFSYRVLFIKPLNGFFSRSNHIFRYFVPFGKTKIHWII